MTLLASHGGAEVHHATWRDLLPIVAAAGGCDALICDAPYSDRTHAGHDGGISSDGGERRSLNYASWTADDVREFVAAWDVLTRGWFVSITDDVLATVWRDAMEGSGKAQRKKRLPAGRYSFAPLPFVARGATVRLTGDGPSSWTNWIVPARPRLPEFSRWGTLPGAYVLPPGESERKPVVGGKPLWLMRALVRDYTRPGDLVVDPCCGGGTTGVACQLEGRRFIGGDMMLAHAEIGAERICALPTQADKRGTLALFGGAT